MKLLQLFFGLKPRLFLSFESLFNTLLSQDGLIFDYVGWWSGFNKGSDIIYNVAIGIHNIVEGMGTKNQEAPRHGGCWEDTNT